jgi:hypothetical protein
MGSQSRCICNINDRELKGTTGRLTSNDMMSIPSFMKNTNVGPEVIRGDNWTDICKDAVITLSTAYWDSNNVPTSCIVHDYRSGV